MKILIISRDFAPINTIGSLRWSKMAKCLVQEGYEVKVITQNNEGFADLSLPLEIPESSLIKVDAPSFASLARADYSSLRNFSKAKERIRVLMKHKYFGALVKDGSFGWVKPAIRAGLNVMNEWRPDIVISSALPITAHIVAKRIISNSKEKPAWFADYRDLWSSGPGARVKKLESVLYSFYEKMLLKKTKKILTVSITLANHLKKVHDKESVVLYNGFDLDDLSIRATNVGSTNEIRIACHRKNGSSLKGDYSVLICYLGSLYEGRNPAILFEALASSLKLRKSVRIQFYTSSDVSFIRESASKIGITKNVEICDRVKYHESLRIQRSADALLHLGYESSTHPGEGVLSGKAFEYLQACRPILGLCVELNHPLVRSNLMVPLNTIDEARKYLEKLVDSKRSDAPFVENLRIGDRKKWTRQAQTKSLIREFW